MRTRICCAAIVAAVVGSWLVGAKPAVGQTLVGSFENSLASPLGGNWEGDGTINPTYSATGATAGSSALAIRHPSTWAIQAIYKGGMPLAQAVTQNDFLAIDVTTTDLGIGGDLASPSWRQIFAIFNSSQGGWQQKQIDYAVAADDGGSSTQTVVLDLSEVLNSPTDPDSVKVNAQQFVDVGGTDGYFELFLAMQGGDQGVIKAGDYAADNGVNAADYVTCATPLAERCSPMKPSHSGRSTRRTTPNGWRNLATTIPGLQRRSTTCDY